MGKIKTILLAVLGGIDVVVTMFMPIIIGTIWINIFGLIGWKSYLIFGLGLFSSLFRAIKIGFMRN
jgi:hypothetical protein